MTSVTVLPQLMAAAAQDVAAIQSAISAANGAAADTITGVAAAAADEVSAAAAALFRSYAGEYQAVIAQATAFHDAFASTLATAGSAYANAEATNAAAVSTAWSAMATPAADAKDITLAMGGSGNPTPDRSYVDAVVSKYVTPNFPAFTLANARALFTPEGFYPLTGIKDLTPDVSVARGVTILADAIHQQLDAGNHVAVLGFSQSSVISSLVMQQLDPSGTPSSLPLSFVLLGDPMNPNGGILERFAGLTFPSLGQTFYGATPANSFPTKIYTIEYDGFADFPRYPINALADLNAMAGIYYVHGTYADLTSQQIATAIALHTEGATQTTYYMIPNPHLPLVQPLRAVPFVGNPLADLIEPDLRVLVNIGFGDPAFGYSTSAANVPTPFGIFPPLDAGAVLGGLAAGTQQGITAFANDISAASFPPLPDLSSITLPLPPSPIGLVDTLASVASTAYSTLLPTADIATTLVISLPAYDLSLFVDALLQVSSGDPLGLINAIANPIAANTGLLAFGAGIEVFVLVNAAQSIIDQLTSL